VGTALKERGFRMLKILRKTWRPNRTLSLGWFSKTFRTMQPMYLSRRKLLWIEIKQIFISLYFLFLLSHQSNKFIARSRIHEYIYFQYK
jgi:hypothetical protein